MKLLIIEDDTGLNRGISFAMEQEGYAVVSARTLRGILECFLYRKSKRRCIPWIH